MFYALGIPVSTATAKTTVILPPLVFAMNVRKEAWKILIFKFEN